MERFIGRGGFADVWLARDEAGYIVVKCVRPGVTDRELDALRRYKQLADDPAMGLIQIHHIGRCEQTDRLYFTMPPADPLHERTFDPAQYEPATLQAWIHQKGSLSVSEVTAVTRDVLSSLAKLHAQGLVHRDIKPSNLVRYHDRWCIGDTGLLAREDALGSEAVAGTPQYLPPEGRTADRSADLYAFGKTLFEMLNGGLDNFPVPSPEHLQPGPRRTTYRSVYRVINRACAPEPADRYHSAQQMSHDLSSPGRQPVRRWLIAAAILAIAVVTFALVWRPVDRVPAPTTLRSLITQQETEFSIRFRRPGPNDTPWEVYGPDSALQPGDSFYVDATVPEALQVRLVLATYVDGVRSVLEHPALRKMAECTWRFGDQIQADGSLKAFRFPGTPAPVLFLLFVRADPFTDGELERAVETILNDEAGWPLRRDMHSPPLPMPPLPLLIRGGHVFPWRSVQSTRGGPRLPVGDVVPENSTAQRVVERLSQLYGPVYGVWTEFKHISSELRKHTNHPFDTRPPDPSR